MQKKRGNKLGFWFFRTLMRLFGLTGAYTLLYFVCIYYLIFDRSAVTVSMAYLKRRFREYGLLRRLHAVYRLFVSQGKSLIDRYYMMARPGYFEFELVGYERLKEQMEASGKGIILLTAHVGNWQAAMTALKKLNKTVHLLMTPEENAAVKSTLNIDDEEERVRIISPNEYLGGIIEIVKVIDEGDIVSIMGDRSYGTQTTGVSLLGETAHMPVGAFRIATTVKCPVVVLLSAKVSRNKYLIDVSHVITPGQVPRSRKDEAIRTQVQELADILDDYAERFPFQWFVFSDIWDRKNETK